MWKYPLMSSLISFFGVKLWLWLFQGLTALSLAVICEAYGCEEFPQGCIGLNLEGEELMVGFEVLRVDYADLAVEFEDWSAHFEDS